MTAVCPSGGASQQRAGFAAAVQITPYGIGALLNNVPTPWAVPLALTLGVIVYELNTFCLVDPPTLPTLVLQDGIDLLHPEKLDTYLPARQKFQDFVGYYAWYQFCECASGTATPPGAPQSEPTGWPNVDPPGAGLPVIVTPCRTDTGAPWTQGTTGSLITGSLSFADLNGTSVRIRITPTSHTGAGVTAKWILEQDKQADTPVTTRLDSFNVGPTTAVEKIYAIDPQTNRLTMSSQFLSGSGTTTYDSFMELFCNGDSPGGAVVPCCAPDPTILGMLAQINAAVQLIQRQSSPFAYVYGASHTGLTDNGNFDVQGLIGVSVDITTLPPSYGQRAGDPVELFGLGFVTLGTADGVVESRRIEADGVLFFPPAAGVYTSVHYSLSPGVVVSIRELVREP